MTAKNWCFTLNNYTENEIMLIEKSFEDGHFKYVVYGKEIGELGTLHLQGYVQCKKKLRMAQLKQMIGSRVHLEVARGTAQQASDYCKKDGDFVCLGQLSTKGGMCPVFGRIINPLYEN